MTQTLMRLDRIPPAVARRYRANRAALSEVAASVLARLNAPAAKPPVLLADVADPDVVLNVAIDNTPFYVTDPRALAAQQVASFVGSDQCFKPGVAAYSPEDEIAYQRIVALDDAFGSPLMTAPKPYIVPSRYAAMLTVFGLGLGWHLELLLERYDVQHLVLFETDIELFHASLYAIDWRKITERFTTRGRSLTFVIEPKPQTALDDLLGALQRPNPALVVASRYFRHYQSPSMDIVAESVSQRLSLLSFGWGYFKDERRQILYTAENIAAPLSWLKRNWPALERADAVVVGAGPSLEKTLSLLQRIRDRVVLISAGSAIRPLVRAGIEPDFHVELETAPLTADILKDLPDRLFNRVPLLVSNGMTPTAVTIFRTTHLFVRESSVSARLLGNTVEQIPGCYPVVGNAAVGIATALGFRRITLFGVDFGYRDPTRHHAAGTIYMDDATGAPVTDLAGAPILDYTDTRYTLPSVLGDMLLADNTFYLSHVAMEIFLVRFPDVALVQCGEGARVARALNLSPVEFNPDMYRGDRAASLAAIQDRFEPAPMSKADYDMRMVEITDAVERMTKRIKRLLGSPQRSVSDYAHLVGEIHHLLRSAAERTPAVYELLFGVFTSYFKATVERSFMTDSISDQSRFLQLAREHFALLLDDLLAAMKPMRAPPPR